MLGLSLTHSQRGRIKREKSHLQQAVFKGIKRHGREAMVIQKMLVIPLTTFETISKSEMFSEVGIESLES